MSEGNRFDQMRAAVRDANYTLDAADTVAAQMAEMLVGRLRKCGGHALKQLKRELRNFNIHTGEWKR